ncbi:MAG: ferrochelatase [Anaerolineales bacterium]|nr:ferrochelatase [Anaerolineales bacterium]
MEFISWIALIILAGALGVLFVQALSIHPLKMSYYIIATCAVLFLIVALLSQSFEKSALIIAMLVVLGMFVVGNLSMTKIILSRDDSRPVPELTREPGDPGLGHTAVVYFTHGEPETYNPIGWINQFNEFDEQGIPFIPMIARPFFFNALRNKYLEVGASGHRKMHHQMIGKLEEAFRAEGDTTTKFYLSFLDDNPRPDAAAIQALNEGASRIIVAEVFLTISNHTAEGEHQIEELNIEERFGIPVEYTGPLYDSETLKSMFVSRANANLGNSDKTKVGILLVGHGQPDEWDVEWPTETEHEIGFRNDVLALLAEDGYKSENLALAWMEFKEPKPAEQIEIFLKNGIEKLMFFSAAISADAIHSQYDIPELVYKAEFPEGFPVIDLGAWNDDPTVIQAIKEKIDALMALDS